MTQSFNKIRGLPYEVNKLQDNVANAISPLLTNPLNFGIIVHDVVFDGSNPVSVNHLLSRQPQGWFIVDKDSAVNPFRVSWDSRTISLNATTAGTVSIFIF